MSVSSEAFCAHFPAPQSNDRAIRISFDPAWLAVLPRRHRRTLKVASSPATAPQSAPCWANTSCRPLRLNRQDGREAESLRVSSPTSVSPVRSRLHYQRSSSVAALRRARKTVELYCLLHTSCPELELGVNGLDPNNLLSTSSQRTMVEIRLHRPRRPRLDR